MDGAEKRILVIADDFSGAAEMAGIGHRYGRKTVLASPYTFPAQAEVIIWNSDTRHLPLEEAKQKIRQAVKAWKQEKEAFWFFKKIDSVLRGHVLAEAWECLEQMALERVFLLSANPSKGRVIKNGKYYIQGTLLENTPFQYDPDFPRTSSVVAELLQAIPQGIPYQHLAGGVLPDKGIYSVDVVTEADLEYNLNQLGERDFCCGGADAFSAFLKMKGLKEKTNPANNISPAADYKIILNGSTFRAADQEAQWQRSSVPQHPLPDSLDWENSEMSDFLSVVKQDLCRARIAHIYVERPVEKASGLNLRIERNFIELVKRLITEMDEARLHFFLTGGSTAAAITESLGADQFEVVEEIQPGLVTLQASHGHILITVKPGSYPWHPAVFKS